MDAPAPQPPPRTGVQTSEFWMSLACLAAGVFLILRGREDLGTMLVGVATGGYQVSRGLAKKS